MARSDELSVVRAAEVVDEAALGPAWLIEGLWGAGAVGVVGGAPKCGKTWLTLEMAVAVASGRPCLGRHEVPVSGAVLVYAAEDAHASVRDRLAGLAAARGADFATLEVGLIVEPSLRLDRAEDLARLSTTLARRRPRLLVLDPYVRLQRVDENDASQVSAILGALRNLSRTHAVAIALVHHARKAPADRAGQALRGSSDFHAWGDSNLFLSRRGQDILLSVEHRAAASPPPITLGLVADDGPVRLELRGLSRAPIEGDSLADRVLAALSANGPRRQEDLRALLGVRNQRLVEALRDLKATGRLVLTSEGWIRARNASVPFPGTIP